MIPVSLELTGAQAVGTAWHRKSIGESKQSRPATFTTMWRFCRRPRWPTRRAPRHESNPPTTATTTMVIRREKSNRHPPPKINQHGQWLASKTATTKWRIAIISKDKFVQNRIKNSFFCDLPIYRKPLDNVVYTPGRRYILLLSTNYSSQVSEK